MYNRNVYISKLAQWRDKPLIKIITGLRRSGKSTLIKLYINYLKEAGINESRIIYINKDSLKYEYIKSYQDLYDAVLAVHSKTKKNVCICR